MKLTPPITNMIDAFSVKEKNVVVTGGNRGIGLGISTAFAQSGANVIILCRNIEKGMTAVEGFQQYGGKHTCFHCDISVMESVASAVKQIYNFFDHVDVLVNNAGIATNVEFLKDREMGEWHRIINTNLHGVANMIYAIAPRMREAGLGGRIINISSVGGQFIGDALSHPNPPYFTSKAALDHFTRYLAIELGADGIRVNCIAPGPFHSDLDADLPDSFKEFINKELPCHRFGEPIEIGAYCVFLSSPAGSHITGSICVHDGGLICRGG
ncbi:MAG: SDR family oxidoreductase [Deltaproteobacteria bacterium]|nr:SDR family oxidoreductase [Deltaproteobacteria bacterium]